MKHKLALLIGTLSFLVLTSTAVADCCSVLSCDLGPNACNIFGCNCAGPCSNFGESCDKGPVKSDGIYGQCPGWTCQTSSNGTTSCRKAYGTTAAPTTTQNAQSPKSAAYGSSAAPTRFENVDTNHDGAISFDELKAWAQKNRAPMTDEVLRAHMAAIDANHDGRISRSEFDSAGSKKK